MQPRENRNSELESGPAVEREVALGPHSRKLSVELGKSNRDREGWPVLKGQRVTSRGKERPWAGPGERMAPRSSPT